MMGKRPEKMQDVLAQRIKTKLGDLQRRSYNGANIYVNLLSSPQDPLLVIPSTRRTTLGDRDFTVTAARAWNAPPSSVRSAPSSLLQFRRDLKTALHVSVIVLYVKACDKQTDGWTDRSVA